MRRDATARPAYDARVVKPPVIVHTSTLAAAELLSDLLGEDYGPAVKAGEAGDATVSVEPSHSVGTRH